MGPFLARGAALSAAPLSAQAVQVRDVDVRGGRALGEGAVREVIHTPQARCRSVFLVPACALGLATRTRAPLDTIQVREDAERIDSLYAAWGYLEARTTPRITSVRGGVEVTFAISDLFGGWPDRSSR